MLFDVSGAKHWIVRLNQKLQEQKKYLTSLDQAIGDGDHGLNMARGFQEVVLKIHDTEYKDLGTFFKDVGMTLILKVGGASGPLYGTAFLKFSMELKEKKEINGIELGEALSAALEGIRSRGRAQLGDKTIVDVWEPVVDLMMSEGENLNPDELIRLANEKMEDTKDMEAKKGRAAYLGKRSIGHIDPGATSSMYLFEALAEVLKGESYEE
ncbi:dihydroxyacetone kinase subunit DhaL [Evansella tamaricis]|uniref:Dihydroxyacetone kinase subunit L n=1 Tax=Evansella tamaricis TaxID=2069301 RepID=A0ABS6JGA7_9BACI|nr:dihydroxyacetone kinase subunit DhaL [Evansella tamaricis]MBU9712631.1 dihydroxyacetone kinase subunit L [Evansella tamaricis]